MVNIQAEMMKWLKSIFQILLGSQIIFEKLNFYYSPVQQQQQQWLIIIQFSQTYFCKNLTNLHAPCVVGKFTKIGSRALVSRG